MPNSLGMSDDEYNKLAFYASMSGMSPEDYVQYMATQAPTPQAPTLAYEAKTQPQKTAIQNSVQQTSAQQFALNAQNRQRQEKFFDDNVTPALGKSTQAYTDLQSANRQGEGELQAGGQALNSSLAATQAQRTGAINSTNAAQSQALAQLTGQMNGINANQTGLYNTLNGQASAINQNQTGLFNNLSGQLSGITAQQNAANSRLQGQLDQYTNAQNAANTSYANNAASTIEAQRVANASLQAQLGTYDNAGDRYLEDFEDRQDQLTAQDRTALNDYMNATNPLLEKMQAQGSDPRYVQQQQDQYDLYKSRSGVEATAEERLLAEQLRRKNENDDKSSREAAYAQMQGRGLNNGGQQIAAQLAARQATSSDRMMAELGIQANAQGRAERNTAGAAGVAAQLRNADDGMRQFQDQYAQNDSVRRQGVMQGRANTNLAFTGQIGNRNTGVYNAEQGNLAAKTGRAGMNFDASSRTNQFTADQYGNIFNAATVTNNANTGRATAGFDATTRTNEGNTNRAGMTFDAGTATNNANFGRNQAVFNAGTTTNEGNERRNTTVFNGATTTNRDNFDRSNVGFQSADANALTGYGTVRDLATTRSGNRGTEAGIAQGNVGLGLAANSAYGGMQDRLTGAQSQAISQVLGNNIVANTAPPGVGDSYGSGGGYTDPGYTGVADTYDDPNDPKKKKKKTVAGSGDQGTPP